MLSRLGEVRAPPIARPELAPHPGTRTDPDCARLAFSWRALGPAGNRGRAWTFMPADLAGQNAPRHRTFSNILGGGGSRSVSTGRPASGQPRRRLAEGALAFYRPLHGARPSPPGIYALQPAELLLAFGERSSGSGGSALAVVAFGSVTMISSHKSGRCRAHDVRCSAQSSACWAAACLATCSVCLAARHG